MSRFKVGDKFKNRQNNQVYEIVAVDAGDWCRLDKISYLVSEHWLSRDYELVERVEVQESENEKKAKELSKGRYIVTREMRQKDYSYEGDCEWEEVKHPIHKQCEQVALAMAEWKDKQFEEEKKDLLGHINMQPINDEKDQIVIEVKSDTANALREILKEFKHPIGSKVWWVGMELKKEGWKWYIVEREVKNVRVYVDNNLLSRRIFLTGLTSYEGENWYNDEFEKLNIAEGLELYGAVGEDYIFDTENDAKKCYEIMKDKV